MFPWPFNCFSPTADSDGVSAQIGSGVVWGGSEEVSTRVPREFCESSAKAPGKFREGFARFIGRFQGGFQEGWRVWRCWGYRLSLFFRTGLFIWDEYDFVCLLSANTVLKGTQVCSQPVMAKKGPYLPETDVRWHHKIFDSPSVASSPIYRPATVP